MDFKVMNFRAIFHFSALVVLAAGLIGCQPVPDSPPHIPNLYLKTGDTIIIQYGGVGAPPSFTTRVNSDGTISPPPSEIGSIKAQGKRVGDLEKELQTKINAYYKQLVVNVEDVRYIYVSGEVNMEGKIQNSEDLTLLKVISAARGFNNFANEKKILLIREGKRYYLNADKALSNPAYDYRIYPGDQITVERRIF